MTPDSRILLHGRKGNIQPYFALKRRSKQAKEENIGNGRPCASFRSDSLTPSRRMTECAVSSPRWPSP